MSADVPEPSVLSGGSVREAHRREVERAALRYVAAVVDRNPLAPARDDVRHSVFRLQPFVRFEEHGERERVPLRRRPCAQPSDSHRVSAAPLAAVLDEVRDFVRRGKADRGRTPGRGERERRELSAAEADSALRLPENAALRVGPPFAAFDGLRRKRHRDADVQQAARLGSLERAVEPEPPAVQLD